MSDQTYSCSICKKKTTVPDGSPQPECCGKPMDPWPLPFCTKAPADPEMARTADEDEPCADGTAPKKR
jgi:hypothetical protein